MFPLFSTSNISIDDAIKPAQVSIKVVTTDQWPKLFMGKAVIGNYINVWNTILQQINAQKGILYWDSNTRPLGYEFPPITTRPELPPLVK